jgi:hypothetical protein
MDAVAADWFTARSAGGTCGCAVDPLIWRTVIATVHWEEVREISLYPAVSGAGTSCNAGPSHFGRTGSSVAMALLSADN